MTTRQVPSGRSLGSRVRPRANRPRGRSLGGRLLLGLIVAAVSIIGYLSSEQYNPVTEEDQEIAIGLQAAPEMTAQFGGLDRSTEAQQLVDEVGQHLVENSVAASAGYPFEFHVLADTQTVNAFALPGGQVFITNALLRELETEGQLAGVLAHEIGHVLARHSAERIAEQELTQGLTGAVVIATYDPENPSSQQTAALAAVIGSLINMKFSREDELQSDDLGVRIMAEAGYDPRSLITVMEILERASGGQGPPEFASTHPSPENRVEAIQAAIDRRFPQGVPDGLIP